MATLLKMPVSLKTTNFLTSVSRLEYVAITAILSFAVLLGLLTPKFVDVADGQVSKIVALPAAMLFGVMLLYDRRLSLMFVILFRSGADNALELTRLSIGGYPLGVGALINGCVILIAILLVLEKPRNVPSNAYIAWAPFLIALLMGLLNAPVKGDALRLSLAMLSHFAMFIASFNCVRNKQEFRHWIKLIVWSSLVPVLYSLVDFGMNHGAPDFRLRSTFAHPNVLAFYTTVVICLTFYLFKTLPKDTTAFQKFCLGMYHFVLLGVLALTQTRSAWIATAMTFGIYALIFERRYLLYMFILGGVALLIPGVVDRLTDLEQGNTVTANASLNSFAWRVYLWQTAVEWMKPASYFLGNGLLSFKEYSQLFFPLAGKMKWGAHSVYVEIFFELGITGLLAFCWLYLSVLRQLLRVVRIDSLAAFSLMMLVVNYLICCFSDNMLDYLSYAWYLWFAVGAGCALVLRLERELNQE